MGLIDTTSSEVKLDRLRGLLGKMGSVLVAFSGGVDSTFLLYVAKHELADRVMAVIATSPTHPEVEFRGAVALAKEIGVTARVIGSSELDVDGYVRNLPDRCYHCKKALFGDILKIAGELGIDTVADGTSADDLSDHRPGRRAARELGVRSPLLEAGFTKDEIRARSNVFGLRTWDAPSMACLASRFPYGTKITRERLGLVERSEEVLRRSGFRQFRVRYHGEVARIEVHPDEIERFMDYSLRTSVDCGLRGLGFIYVSLDLEGYRTGSMNEVLEGDAIMEGEDRGDV